MSNISPLDNVPSDNLASDQEPAQNMQIVQPIVHQYSLQHLMAIGNLPQSHLPLNPQAQAAIDDMNLNMSIQNREQRYLGA